MMMGCRGGPESRDPGLFTCQNINLTSLLSSAYNIVYFQLSAPDWVRDVRFDIRAKVPEGATKDEFRLMLQNLLADRFKLAVHHESRDIAKYDLVVAKNGPKLKPAIEPASASTSTNGQPPVPGPPPRDKEGYPILAPGRPGMAIMNNKARLYDPGMNMEMLANRLGGQMGKPVTDATGLTGKYEIALYWAYEMMRSAAPLGPAAVGGGSTPMPMASIPEGDSGPTLEKAIQDQLGLRLEAKKGPVDFLVVDHAEKTPTDN
jgi:uncharacterized protein (TIGR03435 family)